MGKKFDKGQKYDEDKDDDERKKRKQSGLRRKEQNAKRATKYKIVSSSNSPQS